MFYLEFKKQNPQVAVMEISVTSNLLLTIKFSSIVFTTDDSNAYIWYVVYSLEIR